MMRSSNKTLATMARLARSAIMVIAIIELQTCQGMKRRGTDRLKPKPQASAEDTAGSYHSQPRKSWCPSIRKIFAGLMAIATASKTAGIPDDPRQPIQPSEPTFTKHEMAAIEDGRCGSLIHTRSVPQEKFHVDRDTAIKYLSLFVTYEHTPTEYGKYGEDILTQNTRDELRWNQRNRIYLTFGDKAELEKRFQRHGDKMIQTEKAKLKFLPDFIERMKHWCPNEERLDLNLFAEEITNLENTIAIGEALHEKKVENHPNRTPDGWDHEKGNRMEQRMKHREGIYKWFQDMDEAWARLLLKVNNEVGEQISVDGRNQHLDYQECDETGLPVVDDDPRR